METIQKNNLVRNLYTNKTLLQGVGRRRFTDRTLGFQPEFLQWMPRSSHFEKGGTSKSSVYKLDYSDQPIPQIMIRRPKTSFDNDDILSTSYRYAHGNDNPHKSTLNAMCNAAFAKPESKKIRMSRPLGRESVATCMSWYVPKPATGVYEVPHYYKPRKGTTPSCTTVVSQEAMQKRSQEQQQSQVTTLSSDTGTVLSAAPSATASPAAAAPVAAVATQSAPVSATPSQACVAEC